MPLVARQRQWLRGVIDGLAVLSDNRCAMPCEQLALILTELAGVIERFIPGDIVEMGCASCSTSLRLGALLKLLGEGRLLHLYDSFQGFPEPTVEDEQSPGWEERECSYLTYPTEGPENLFRRWGDGLPIPVVHAGFFQEESDPDNPHPNPIGLALLDCDMYCSLKTALRIVWPRLAPGGVVLVHDYNNPTWPGVNQAVSEHFSQATTQIQVERCEVKHTTMLIIGKKEPRR